MTEKGKLHVKNVGFDKRSKNVYNGKIRNSLLISKSWA